MSDFNENPFESDSGFTPPEDPFKKDNGQNEPTVTSEPSPYGYTSGEEYVNPDLPPEKEKKSGMSITAMVLGICGVALQLVCCCCALLSSLPCLALSVAALVLGIVAYRKHKDGMALAGIILGAIGTVLAIVLSIIWITSSASFDKFLEEFYKEYPEYRPDSSRGDISFRMISVIKRIIGR